MSSKINADVCVGCGACSGTCPVEAIAPQEDKYFIDAVKCTGCGACEEACPVSAISAQ
jgi:ferredoxin